MRSFQDELKGFIEKILESKHSGLPATVEQFYPDRQMVRVQVLFEETYLDDDDKPFKIKFPVIDNVPVQYPRFGNWVMTFPIEKDNSCWLNFSSRSLDDFLETDFKSIVTLQEVRTMDINDAIATFEFSTAKNKLSNFNMNGLVLRSLNNDTYLEIKADGTFNLKGTRLNVGADSASKAVARGDKTGGNFDKVSQYILGITPAITAACALIGTLPPTPPTFDNVNSGKIFTND